MDHIAISHLGSLTNATTAHEIRSLYAVAGTTPAVVVRPETEAEVAAVLRTASALGAVVVPWGAGRHQELGHLPERVDLVVSLERLNRVVEYVPADMTITVQAGIQMGAIQAITRPHGQTVPLDSPGASQATMGGIVATGASGPRRMAHGGVRDLLLGTRIVLADGRVIRTGGRVVKNVAGYDMNKLVCGSLGTVGIITEVTLKLRPLPAESRTLLFAMPDLPAALSAAEGVLNSELLPAAVVVLGVGPARRLEVPGPFTLVVALEEMPENVAYQTTRLAGPIPEAVQPASVLADEAEAQFWEAVCNYGDRFRAPCQIRVSTVISDLGRQMERAGTSEIDAIAHVGTGTVMLYGWATEATAIAPWFGPDRQPQDGAVILERAPTAIRRIVEPWGASRPEWKLIRSIKLKLDPGRILNRGRYVGGI